MTLDKCIVLRIGTLTGCPLCRESHPLCRLKNPTVISIWLLVGFHPATRSVLSTPADNTRKRVWQYIEKERKMWFFVYFLSACVLMRTWRFAVMSCVCPLINYTLATEENVRNVRVCACCNHFPITWNKFYRNTQLEIISNIRTRYIFQRVF